MQIQANELNAIKVLALSMANIESLGNFAGKETMVSNLKATKKAFWATMRARYNIPKVKGQSLAIELDGDRAGELRYKARNDVDKADPGRRVVQAPTPQSTAPSNGQAAALASAQEALQQASAAIAALNGGNGATYPH